MLLKTLDFICLTHMKHSVLISCGWLLKKILLITTNLTNPESAFDTTSGMNWLLLYAHGTGISTWGYDTFHLLPKKLNVIASFSSGEIVSHVFVACFSIDHFL